MKHGKILIKELPFEEIIRSAYETLKIECGGFLFGERFEKGKKLIWAIESAHPIQLAKRFPSSYEPQDGSIRADWSLLHETIWGYHLHPTSRQQQNGIRKTRPGKICLSECDRKNLREDPKGIEIIMSLKRVKRTITLKDNPFIVAGYLREGGIIYHIDMGGYYFNGRIYKALIEVPKRILKEIR